METQLLHRGRLIDHIQMVVADIKASRTFYDAVFDVLGVPLGGELGDDFWYDELFVSTKDSEAALGELTGPHHLAFQAAARAAVDAFYQAGLAAGRRANGAPGERPYHTGYYATFLLDPDGEKIDAVCQRDHTSKQPS